MVFRAASQFRRMEQEVQGILDSAALLVVQNQHAKVRCIAASFSNSRIMTT